MKILKLLTKVRKSLVLAAIALSITPTLAQTIEIYVNPTTWAASHTGGTGCPADTKLPRYRRKPSSFSQLVQDFQDYHFSYTLSSPLGASSFLPQSYSEKFEWLQAQF